MKITLTNAGKRFNRDWIFRHLNYQFIEGHSYAIVGPNGSGKSTLLQSIAAAIALSEGKIEYDSGALPMTVDPKSSAAAKISNRPAIPANNISTENIFSQLSFSAPYLELIEEMTLREFLAFHHIFKPFMDGLSFEQIIDSVQLQDAADKQIRYYSSGMKQRAKLAQAIFSDTPVILLDEPCTNLDQDGVALYQQLMKENSHDRLVIVSSNDIQEYGFCEERIEMRNHK